MLELYNLCWLILAQVPKGAEAAVDAAGNAAGQAANKPPGLFDGMGWFLPAMMVMMVFMLLMGRQQPNAAAKTSEMLAKLKKNDRVITAGGILGTVVSFGTGDEYVTLRIDDSSNTRMQVLASSIVRVVSDKDAKTS